MEPQNENPRSKTNTLLYILIGLVGVLIVVGIMALIAAFSLRGSESAQATEAAPTAIGVPTLDLTPLPTSPTQPDSSPTPNTPVILPTAAPQNPTGQVTAANGVNVRTGPGEVYPILGIAPFGTQGQIIGRSADGLWWVVALPTGPNAQGWVSAQFVNASNADGVPVIPAPPTPTPSHTATPTATATPQVTATPSISFTADRTVINQGECTTLRWSVENIQAVWVYPLGEPYQNFPVTGQGSRQECPPVTTVYEMRVLQPDDTIALRQVTIQVTVTNPLANSNWRLASLNAGTVPVAGSVPTVAFRADNTVNADSGCNTFSGPYTVNGSSLTVGPLSGTQVACSQELGQQEAAYIIALQAAATYQISGSQLIIRNGAGQEVLRFDRIG